MDFYIYVCLILEFENMLMLISIKNSFKSVIFKIFIGLSNSIFLLYSIIVYVYDWILKKYCNLRFV